MICYKDKTFCASDCKNNLCHRFFGPEQSAAAEKWWGSKSAPVAFMDCSNGCFGYMTKPPSNQ